eukprot:GHVL01025439.1.p1 GENE.GHVL01025439.1~~GHVL01025439.1.p1  ORF type:complete len:398 (+),score=85.37 GHVL01025439.1:671-1864(+)
MESPACKSLLHYKFGKFCLKSRKIDLAKKHTLLALSIKPECCMYNDLLGNIYIYEKDGKNALECYIICIKKRPKNIYFWSRKVVCEMMICDYKNSLLSCNIAIDIYENVYKDDDIIYENVDEIYMNMCMILRILNRKNEAINIIKKKIGDVCMIICEDTCIYLDICVVCVKWGSLYDEVDVNALYTGVKKHLEFFEFICFTDNPLGLNENIKTRCLPTHFERWWGKAYLFSAESGLHGKRVLYIDLDTVIIGDLNQLLQRNCEFEILSTNNIFCELAKNGYNSSIMIWNAGPKFQPVFNQLNDTVLKFVHRFDHWLEIVIKNASLIDHSHDGFIVDFVTKFTEENNNLYNIIINNKKIKFTDQSLKNISLIIFPRYPKPRDPKVLEYFSFISEYYKM